MEREGTRSWSQSPSGSPSVLGSWSGHGILRTELREKGGAETFGGVIFFLRVKKKNIQKNYLRKYNTRKKRYKQVPKWPERGTAHRAPRPTQFKPHNIPLTQQKVAFWVLFFFSLTNI